MQSKFGSPHGLPLCLSGFTLSHPSSLSTEMADHDRRREAMRRRQRSSAADPEIGFSRRNMLFEAITDGGGEDLEAFLHETTYLTACAAAKAA